MREAGERRQAVRKRVTPIRLRPTIRLHRMSGRMREPKIAEHIEPARKTLPVPAPGRVPLHFRKAAHSPPEAYDVTHGPLRREQHAPPVPIPGGQYERG